MQKKIIIALLCLLALYFYRSQESYDWPIANAHPGGGSIVAFGDSLTLGHGAPNGMAYPDHLTKLIGYPITNLGNNGDTSPMALQRLEEVINQDPDLVIITLGGNDILRKLPETESIEALRSIFSQLHANSILVAYAAIEPPFIRKTRLNKIKELCKELGVIYIPKVMNNMWKNAELMSDNIHPNAAGYKLMASRIYKKVTLYFP